MREHEKHYHPPNKDYLPPQNPSHHHEDHLNPTYEKPDHYGPPTKDYLPPMREYQKHYHPPNKDYLPPQNPSHLHDAHVNPTFEKPDHYGPPTKDYLPPIREYQKHYHPPNKDYLPPKNPGHHQESYENPIYDKPDHYGPPTKQYLPPVREDQKYYHPPNKEYLPPEQSGHHRESHIKPTYDVPDHYGTPTKDYLAPMREEQKHYHPPNKDYLPPEASGYDVPSKEYLPPTHPQFSYEDPTQHYSPPASDYVRPQLSVPSSLHHLPGAEYLPPPSRLDLKLAESTEYPPGAQGPRPHHELVHRPPSPTVGPIPGYLPPPPEKLESDLVPSLKEVLAALGPPLSGPALLLPDGGVGPGSQPGLLPPPPPLPEKLTSGYLPPPGGYPEISGPLSDYLPPKGGPALVLPDKYGADAYIPPPEKVLEGGGYIPPPAKVKGGYIPPPELSGLLSDYLPPPDGPALVLPHAKKRPHTSERYIAPPEVQILNIKTKPDYIPPPLRPQTPPPGDVPEPPPPEAIPSELPPLERLNSQTTVPLGLEEPYIPMKTIHDVPKNFRRPALASDLPPALPPELLPGEIDPDAEPIAPGAFLGLAKLKDPKTAGDGKDDDEDDDDGKSGKIVRLPEGEEGDDSSTELRSGPRFPPMPTMPPAPSSFLPLLEELSPSLVASLRGAINLPNLQPESGGGRGKIPGTPGVDYPDFKAIPVTEFSCENFILEGFYADTFTSCQVTALFNRSRKCLPLTYSTDFFHIFRCFTSANQGGASLRSSVQGELYSIRNIGFATGGTT